MIAVFHFAAFEALSAGVVLKRSTEECLGKRPGRLHLPAPRWTAEYISMADGVSAKGVLQHLLCRILTRNICKRHISSLPNIDGPEDGSPGRRIDVTIRHSIYTYSLSCTMGFTYSYFF
ncbi:hypothetical protein J21TS7_65440 [Paenibacillus cineris]|uniref:Uncharacterized protein n=1 Tax=Paenibacillus cineris TaxID=237530 RepID=A0ABQ4LNY4_9BACL|nr:hypothetical protein J21TS7_65440 [Paenibacillus cineris]